MLVGKTIKLKELEKKMKEKIDEKKMQIKKLNDDLNLLNKRYNELPKLKNEPPTQAMIETVNEIRAKNKELDETQEKIVFLKRKLDEASEAKDKEQNVYMTLSDCIYYEIE
jgi:chromosome segregation ATPase